jgi:Leucine-rich repeat (LRR) protein
LFFAVALALVALLAGFAQTQVRRSLIIEAMNAEGIEIETTARFERSGLGRLTSLFDSTPYVKSINVSGAARPLYHISLLGYFPELKHIGLDWTQVQDINDLRSFYDLRTLTCRNSRIRDFVVLKNLNGLKVLDASGCHVERIEFGAASELESLVMNNCDLTSISFLRSIPRLSSLSLDNVQIRDFSPLYKCSNLKTLSLNDNVLVNVDFLARMTELKALHLRNAQIDDLSAASTLHKLESLDVIGVRAPTLQPLSQLENIACLRLDWPDDGLINWKCRGRLIELEVHVDSGSMHSAPLRECSSLRRLTLHGPITSIESIDLPESIEHLDLGDTLIADVEALGDLPRLRNLVLNWNLFTVAEQVYYTSRKPTTLSLEFVMFGPNGLD